MNIVEELENKTISKKSETFNKVAFAIDLLGNDHNEFDNFIIAIFNLQEKNKGVMTQGNFCRFLIDYEKAAIDYKDNETISFAKYKMLLASSIQKYSKAECADYLIKLAIFASACYTLEDLLAFCKLPVRHDEFDYTF